VVAPDHGGARETIVQGQTGWLVPPGDKAALANALREALGLSKEARQDFAERTVKSVRENFSKDAMFAKTLRVYEEVLADHGKDVMA